MYNKLVRKIKIIKNKGEVISMLDLKKLELKESDVKKIKQIAIKIVVSILVTMWIIGVVAMAVSLIKWVLADSARLTIAISSLSVLVGTKLSKTLKI
jgi:uncharacterized membrane protein YqjE